MATIKIGGKNYVEQRDCFLKDLHEGRYFRVKATGGTLYKVETRHETHCLIIIVDKNEARHGDYSMPVRPLKMF